MSVENKFPKRKHPRLNNYNYSSNGAYFITICTQISKSFLSHIVGRGLAPAETSDKNSYQIVTTTFGKIAEKELLLLEERYPYLSVDRYVIMPNHIHIVFILTNEAAGASPRPTIMDIVCSYKSLTTIKCKKAGLTDKLFQTSFYEHIIRDREDYDGIAKYICENPIHWHYDELYSEE